MEVCFTLLSATDIDEFGGFDRFRVRIRSMESFEIKISTEKVQRLSEGSFSLNKEKLKFSFDESDVICFDDTICFEFQVMNEENTIYGDLIKFDLPLTEESPLKAKKFTLLEGGIDVGCLEMDVEWMKVEGDGNDDETEEESGSGEEISEEEDEILESDEEQEEEEDDLERRASEIMMKRNQSKSSYNTSSSNTLGAPSLQAPPLTPSSSFISSSSQLLPVSTHLLLPPKAWFFPTRPSSLSLELEVTRISVMLVGDDYPSLSDVRLRIQLSNHPNISSTISLPSHLWQQPPPQPQNTTSSENNQNTPNKATTKFSCVVSPDKTGVIPLLSLNLPLDEILTLVQKKSSLSTINPKNPASFSPRITLSLMSDSFIGSPLKGEIDFVSLLFSQTPSLSVCLRSLEGDLALLSCSSTPLTSPPLSPPPEVLPPNIPSLNLFLEASSITFSNLPPQLVEASGAGFRVRVEMKGSGVIQELDLEGDVFNAKKKVMMKPPPGFNLFTHIPSMDVMMVSLMSHSGPLDPTPINKTGKKKSKSKSRKVFSHSVSIPTRVFLSEGFTKEGNDRDGVVVDIPLYPLHSSPGSCPNDPSLSFRCRLKVDSRTKGYLIQAASLPPIEECEDEDDKTQITSSIINQNHPQSSSSSPQYYPSSSHLRSIRTMRATSVSGWQEQGFERGMCGKLLLTISCFQFPKSAFIESMRTLPSSLTLEMGNNIDGNTSSSMKLSLQDIQEDSPYLVWKPSNKKKNGLIKMKRLTFTPSQRLPPILTISLTSDHPLLNQRWTINLSSSFFSPNRSCSLSLPFDISSLSTLRQTAMKSSSSLPIFLREEFEEEISLCSFLHTSYLIENTKIGSRSSSKIDLSNHEILDATTPSNSTSRSNSFSPLSVQLLEDPCERRGSSSLSVHVIGRDAEEWVTLSSAGSLGQVIWSNIINQTTSSITIKVSQVSETSQISNSEGREEEVIWIGSDVLSLFHHETVQLSHPCKARIRISKTNVQDGNDISQFSPSLYSIPTSHKSTQLLSFTNFRFSPQLHKLRLFLILEPVDGDPLLFPTPTISPPINPKSVPTFSIPTSNDHLSYKLSLVSFENSKNLPNFDLLSSTIIHLPPTPQSTSFSTSINFSSSSSSSQPSRRNVPPSSLCEATLNLFSSLSSSKINDSSGVGIMKFSLNHLASCASSSSSSQSSETSSSKMILLQASLTISTRSNEESNWESFLEVSESGMKIQGSSSQTIDFFLPFLDVSTLDVQISLLITTSDGEEEFEFSTSSPLSNLIPPSAIGKLDNGFSSSIPLTFVQSSGQNNKLLFPTVHFSSSLFPHFSLSSSNSIPESLKPINAWVPLIQSGFVLDSQRLIQILLLSGESYSEKELTALIHLLEMVSSKLGFSPSPIDQLLDDGSVLMLVDSMSNSRHDETSSVHTIDELRSLFYAIDKDHSGSINRQELAAGFCGKENLLRDLNMGHYDIQELFNLMVWEIIMIKSHKFYFFLLHVGCEWRWGDILGGMGCFLVISSFPSFPHSSVFENSSPLSPSLVHPYSLLFPCYQRGVAPDQDGDLGCGN